MKNIPAWISLVVAVAYNTLSMLMLASVFLAGSKAALVVAIVNIALFNVVAILGIPIVGGKAVISSTVTTTTTTEATAQPSATPPTLPPALPPAPLPLPPAPAPLPMAAAALAPGPVVAPTGPPKPRGGGGSLVLLLAASLSLGACANDPMTNYWRVAGTGAVAVGEAYRMLDTFDSQRLRTIQNDFHDGRITNEGAKVQRDAWLSTYNKTRKGLDTLSATVREAFALGPSIAGSINRDASVASWLARLATLTADTYKVLKDAGVVP